MAAGLALHEAIACAAASPTCGIDGATAFLPTRVLGVEFERTFETYLAPNDSCDGFDPATREPQKH